MKKILCAILAVVMLLSVCGCQTAVSGPAFTAGEVNGNVYTNEFAGITFTAPEDWTFSTEEELAELMDVSLDLVADENEYAKKIAELSTVYGMMASSTDGATNVQVMFENVAITGNRNITAEDYVSTVTGMLESTYADMGATCSINDAETIKIGENEYVYLTVDVEYLGVSMQQAYACRKIDKYMANIVITAAGDLTSDDVVAMFS